MKLSNLLPDNLLEYAKVNTSDELFHLLHSKPKDLIEFFEITSEDETWSDHHSDLMKKIIDYATREAYHDKLPYTYVRRFAQAIRQHQDVLGHLASENLTIQLEDKSILINGLLLQAISPFFQQMIQKERLNESDTLKFLTVSSSQFDAIKEFALSGEIQNLWKKTPEDITSLLRLASSWSIQGIVEQCEKALCKYITVDNVLNTLLKAHQERWFFLKQYCIDFINEQDLGIRLSFEYIDRLSIEFKDFSDNAIRYFEHLRMIVTDIVCLGNLIDDPHFPIILKQCPRLRGVDISGTFHYSTVFEEIPQTIEELNLSQCPWITKEILRKFSAQFPNLKALSFTSDVYFNIGIWSELIRFQELKKLDLSRCIQLRNEDAFVIFKACGKLIDLSLDSCSKLNEAAYFELAKSAPLLWKLVVSRCQISNTALLEIVTKCRMLAYLDLSYCEEISEKGLWSMMKYANSLQELKLIRINLSNTFIDEFTTRYPLIKTQFVS